MHEVAPFFVWSLRQLGFKDARFGAGATLSQASLFHPVFLKQLIQIDIHRTSVYRPSNIYEKPINSEQTLLKQGLNMQLIGYLDSPFVRRVAITMQFLGIECTHRELSIFRNYDEFRTINRLYQLEIKKY